MPDEGLVSAEIVNGRRIAAGLKAAPREMKKELRQAHKKTAKEAERWIRDAAKAGTPQQRHMANAIKGNATSTQARIATAPGPKGSKTAGARGAFYGSKKFRQFPAWVGNSWRPAVRGQGPQPHNDVLADKKPETETIFMKGQEDALRRTLPRY
jgi:hypothetical protein